MTKLGKIDENDIFDGIETGDGDWSAMEINYPGPQGSQGSQGSPQLPELPELPEYTYKLPESGNSNLEKSDAALASVRMKRPKGNNESVKLFEVYNEMNLGNPYISKFGARSVAEVKAGYKKNRTKKHKKHKKHKKPTAKQIAKKRASASIKRATRGLRVAQSAVKRAKKTLKNAKKSYKKVA